MTLKSSKNSQNITPKRKAALKTADVSREIRHQLNTGILESGSLAEWLVVDHAILLDHVFANTPFADSTKIIKAELKQIKKLTSMSATKIIGEQLLNIAPAKQQRKNIRKILSQHASDTVRGWCCIFIGLDSSLSLDDRLKLIIPLADDSHFGVKEMAWMGIRHSLISDLKTMITLLEPLSLHPSENIRRFASEVSRPCGVWCAHIQDLKKTPELAIKILQPLKSDSSRYVQNSVANWPNDASKSKPDWVRSLCDQWLVDSPTTETKYICKRALRTLRNTSNN